MQDHSALRHETHRQGCTVRQAGLAAVLIGDYSKCGRSTAAQTVFLQCSAVPPRNYVLGNVDTAAFMRCVHPHITRLPYTWLLHDAVKTLNADQHAAIEKASSHTCLCACGGFCQGGLSCQAHSCCAARLVMHRALGCHAAAAAFTTILGSLTKYALLLNTQDKSVQRAGYATQPMQTRGFVLHKAGCGEAKKA